jgi:hypothetical protein
MARRYGAPASCCCFGSCRTPRGRGSCLGWSAQGWVGGSYRWRGRVSGGRTAICAVGLFPGVMMERLNQREPLLSKRALTIQTWPKTMIAMIKEQNPKKVTCHLPTPRSEIELARFARMLHQVRPSRTPLLRSHGHQLLYSLQPANEHPAHAGGRLASYSYHIHFRCCSTRLCPFRSPRSSRRI